MVDLQADKSIVRNLLALGEDVYVIDWGYPDRSDRFLTLEDYIERYLGGAVDHLRARFGLDSINLLGICQGGAFSLCYAALHPDRIRNLITMVTPVDFHTDDNMLSNWTRGMDVDLFVDTLGNVPADLMNLCYLTLKPWRLFVQKYVGLVDILDDKQALEDFLRMEKWIFDSPDQAGEAFRQFVKQFYQGNGFVNGGIVIGDREVHLGLVEMPILNIYAEQDHLVPPSASRPLKHLAGSRDYSELSFRGGHIGIYVSSRAQKEVPSAIHDWLAKRAG
jgi:polyhydroxyalkanoate synthase